MSQEPFPHLIVEKLLPGAMGQLPRCGQRVSPELVTLGHSPSYIPNSEETRIHQDESREGGSPSGMCFPHQGPALSLLHSPRSPACCGESSRTPQAGLSSWSQSCSAAQGRCLLGRLVWKSSSGDFAELQGMVGASSKAPQGPRGCSAAQMPFPVLSTPHG